MSEFTFLNDKKITELDKIIEFNKKLNLFEYGIPYAKTSDCFNEEGFDAYRLLTPEEFEKFQNGICWDYAAYEHYFIKNNIKFDYLNSFFEISGLKDSEETPTHTWTVVGINNKFYYLESSWKPYIGVYEFNSVDDINSFVISRMKESDLKRNKKWKWWKLSEYDASEYPKFGINTDQYMREMWKLKKINFTFKNVKPNKTWNCDQKLPENKPY